MSKLITTHDDMNWTTLSSEYLFRRPWLTVRRDRVRLPNGTEHPEFYILEYPTWVNVVAITDNDEFVMIRQYRHGIRQTRYEIVAGCAEEGEDLELAARRELAEETGYTGGQWTLLNTLSPNATSNNNLSYSYLAQGVVKTGGQHLDATEDIQICLLSRQEVFQLLDSGELCQSLMAAALWKYFYKEMAKNAADEPKLPQF